MWVTPSWAPQQTPKYPWFVERTTMKVGVFTDEAAVAKAAAAYLMETMDAATVCNLGVATGSTPLPLYAELRAAHADGKFSLAKAKAFALDEYIGLEFGHSESYRKVLQNELVGADKVGLADENLFTPNGNVDVPVGAREAADAYDALIRDNGGVHLQILRSEERRVGKECRSRWSPYH